MLVEIVIYIIGVLINFLAQYMPGYGQVPLLLPWGLDSIIVTGVAGFKLLAVSFPPFQTVLDAFLILLGFKIIMRVLKAVPILGRTIS